MAQTIDKRFPNSAKEAGFSVNVRYHGNRQKTHAKTLPPHPPAARIWIKSFSTLKVKSPLSAACEIKVQVKPNKHINPKVTL